MFQSSNTALSPVINLVWLTFADSNPPTIIQCHLLGLGEDHSLLCGFPEPATPNGFEPGMICQGHTIIEGDTYQFQSSIRELRVSPPAFLLNCPQKITRRAPRIYPRVPISISGTIRPLSENGKILAVLPTTMSDICPTGCQLTVSDPNWPKLASLQVVVTCRLPGISSTSKLPGIIEWIEPTPELHMGIQFHFPSPDDPGCLDLARWFHTQQAKFVNTTA